MERRRSEVVSVFAKNLYDLRRGLFWWAAGLLLMNLWLVSLFPTIQESAAPLQQYLDSLPATFRALIGESATFTTLEGYLTVELFAFFWPALTIGFAIAHGSGAIGAEEESGTLDLLLSHPLPRRKLLLEKFAAVAVFSGLAILAGLLGLVLGAALVETSVDYVKVAAAVLDLWLLTVLFAAFTLALTGLGLRRGAAAGIGAGVTAVTFLLNTMGPMADLPDVLRRITPWYYYGGGAALKDGLAPGNTVLLAALVVVFLGIALFGFQRRDLAV
jgi:ABC-2 type transport system permease protein